MTQQEIQERNEQIALMLGKKYKDNSIVIHYNNVCGVNPTGETWQECLYHSDWNWLMEAVEFINKIHKDNNPYRDLHYTVGYLLHGGWWGKTKIPKRLLSNKTQLFLAVSDFAKLYNNKEL